jgi:hypothetical protein
MAHIHPAGWREVAATGAALREIETLSELAQSLPDAYIVYHGVHWTNIEKGFSIYGEVDFIVVAPNGKALLIEQKSGFLTETEDGLIKSYLGREKSVPAQILRTIHNLMLRFSNNGEHLAIEYVLYCPDYQVRNPKMAGIVASHIVDAGRKNQLAAIIEKLLPVTDEMPQLAKVKRFLGEELNLQPDPSSMIGCAATMVTRLSGGLATWARQLEFSPYRLRVIGTAGSGKTQLALAEYIAAIDAGLRPLYVCFNRPLADHVQRLLPDGGSVASMHMLFDAYYRAQGGVPDYQAPAVFADMERTLTEADLSDAWRYDVVIVDEGQDFQAGWRDIVLRMLKPEGRAIWLEDPMQNLYGRPLLDLPGWVTLRAQTNFRNPRQIVEMLSSIGATAGPVEAGSPFLGADIDFLTYAVGNTQKMYEQTRQAIALCRQGGFTDGDIALVSYCGREKSALLHLDALGADALTSFTGEYDGAGYPVFREGAILAESVYRFKGQSAQAVIFAEIDFEVLDERQLRKLFVGMTRARLKLILVISEFAAGVLLERI